MIFFPFINIHAYILIRLGKATKRQFSIRSFEFWRVPEKTE